MKIEINKVLYQLYFLPYIKVTYNKILNGNYELIFGWVNRELVITFGKKHDYEHISEDEKCIFDWDLHMKVMEKKYGKSKISTTYKYKIKDR